VKVALVLGFLAAALVATGSAPAQPATPRVLAVEFANDVNPVTADYVIGEIERANDEGYDAVAILLDTPGGLLDSMRKIVQAELGSEIPVIVYVSPDGARAASAGVWIGQAADLLAMAPQTNIGSSTPISSGGQDLDEDIRDKAVNDAAASLRALAESHGRNAEWADAAVREASNLSATEALEQNVIDAIAPSLPELLVQTDGYETTPKGFTLQLAGAQIDEVEMSGWKKILDTIIDPNVITLLLSIGVLGILVELYNPGLVFPGAVGGISLILGLFGLSVLPVSWAGILLMILAAGFFVAEAFVPSAGALTLAGAVSFVLGALLLFDPAGDAYQVSWQVAIAIAGTLALFSGVVGAKVLRLRRAPVASGTHTLVGSHGVVRGNGLVFVNGELWRAHGPEGRRLLPGDEVTVESVDQSGLELAVRPLEPSAAAEHRHA
jgi:membrane-bound serine protease (ClpP class)